MPRKLGQHFLKNKSVLMKIAETLELKDGDFVIEIGPGHGELTEEIRNQKSKIKILAIEIDKNLACSLRNKFLGDKQIEIIEGDALKEIKDQISKIKAKDKNSQVIENLEIVGNIPYYITGHLLRVVGELEHKPSKVVLLMQKEVAQRICALPPHSNLLSLSVQFWAEPKIILSVPAKDFLPPPEVESAVVFMRTLKKETDDAAESYYSFIKSAFKHPRKTLYNNLLEAGFSKKIILEAFNSLKIEPNVRAAVLGVSEAEKMSRMLYS